MPFTDPDTRIIAGRDPSVFDDLFRQYSKALFYFAAKFVEEEVARDLVQDVFMKLWSDPAIVAQRSMNALLFTMVRNLCLQHLEKQKVRSRHFLTARLSLQEEELATYMNDRTSLIEKEMDQKFRQVLDSLPDRCRQIFLMSRYEDKKNREIAESLQISVKAVEKQLTKALATFRTEMKDYLPLLIFLAFPLFKK